MIGYIVDHGPAGGLQREHERLAEAAEIPDVHDVRLEVGEFRAEDRVVVAFEAVEPADAEPWVPEEAVDAQPAVHVARADLPADAMGGGEHAHVVAAVAQQIDDLPAAFLVAADGVRRIEVGKHEDLQRRYLRLRIRPPRARKRTRASTARARRYARGRWERRRLHGTGGRR